VRQIARPLEAGKNVLSRQARIASKDLLLSLTGGEQFQNEFDSETGAAHHRLSGQDLRIDHNALRNRHASILPPNGRRDRCYLPAALAGSNSQTLPVSSA